MLKVVEAQTAPEILRDQATASPIDLREIEKREDDLIRQLRTEANKATEDFTKYAFRALAGSGVAFAAIIEFMFFSPFGREPIPLNHEHLAQGQPFMGFAAVPVLIFVLMTLRMGTYSATLSNRHLGYDLFISRVRDVPARLRGRWIDAYRAIGFEQAMRAWRVVQDSLFRTICEERQFLRPHRYRRDFRPSARNPMWFNQESLFGQGSNARWNEDSYLRVMQFMLLVAAAIAVLILWITPPAIYYWVPPTGEHDLVGTALSDPAIKSKLVLISGFFAFLGTGAIVVSYRNERARRFLLADGILSIHSYAISWHAVVVAHFCAIERARNAGLTSWELARLTKRLTRAQMKDCRTGKVRFEDLIKKLGVKPNSTGVPDGAGLTGYSFWLGQEAESVERCAKDIPGWIGLGEERLRVLGRIP